MVSAIKEMLASHEALRKLGFLPGDIYVTVDPSGTAVVILKAQDLEFNITCGSFDAGAEEFARQWTEAVERWNNSMPAEEMDGIWRNSFAFANIAQLILALKQKGFYVPGVDGKDRTWN